MPDNHALDGDLPRADAIFSVDADGRGLDDGVPFSLCGLKALQCRHSHGRQLFAFECTSTRRRAWRGLQVASVQHYPP